MPRCQAGPVEIEYEVLGDPSHPTLLLIRGLGGQLIAWADEFCQMLVDRGFKVVRFDNRDVGLSTKMDQFEPDPAGVVDALRAGLPPEAPYLIEDMADDAAALLSEVADGPAHVVGMSLGGMIAQALAIGHPGQVASLCCIMSTTGAPQVGQPTREAAEALVGGTTPTTPAEAADADLRASRVLGSPGFPPEDDRRRRVATASFDRCHCPDGEARQLTAILASPDRTEALRRVEVPTVVIHGEQDPLVTPSGGRATAQAVPGARLVMVPGMGHDLPEPLWPLLVEEITHNAAAGGFSGR